MFIIFIEVDVALNIFVDLIETRAADAAVKGLNCRAFLNPPICSFLSITFLFLIEKSVLNLVVADSTLSYSPS